MKSRFSTIDITVVIRELLRFVSMRVMNVYDVDNKTYLIRLGKPDDKAVIVLESGIKIHSTEFEWPKNPAPSSFSMKMRKHLKGRRLESVRQLGIDRIIDLTFGSGEAAYHVILELYDRGNIVLTDYVYTILNILRPRTDNSQDVKFAVRETYPVDAVKQHELPTEEKLYKILTAAKEGDSLKKLLIPNLDYGPAIIEHCLIGAGIPENAKIGRGFLISKDMPKLLIAIEEAEDLLNIFQTQTCKGFITQKCEKRPSPQDGGPSELLTYDEFHPMLFRQYQNKKYLEFESFNKSVDQFYSEVESQKIELKTLQQERTALKKLENVKKDHEKRVEGLQKEQETDKVKGQLIEMNLDLVDRALLIVRSAIANQIDWTEIKNLVKEAQADGDPVAMAIKDLKLDTNHITMLLQNPYFDSDFEDDDDDDYIKPMKIDIDLGLSAYSNSRKYYDMKKHAAVKEQKTLDASVKALKSAERKTKETLKDVATAASINRARKTYWFEKFLWFITSENFLVVGGRDQQQNELIVKRYMKQGDIYVHADLHGASSVLIKNTTGEPVPPKTLNEAGTMAICNSAAWDAKVVTSAWWVYPSQVSKTAPSGEYLTTGSFMIRGKKNYLPPSYLIYGFAVLFKLEESSISRHLGERKIRVAEDDELSVADTIATESELTEVTLSDQELDDSDDEDDNIKDDKDRTDENCDMVKKEESGDTKSDLDCSASTESDNKQGANISISAKNIENEENQDEIKTESVVSETDIKINVSGDKGNETEITTDPDGKEERKNQIVEFPDTEISLQHVQGDKYELSRSVSCSSQGTESDAIYLGDNVPVTLSEPVSHSGVKLSAKQRRELKKARKQQQQGPEREDKEEDKVSWLAEETQGKSRKSQIDKEVQQQTQQSTQPKRGQKSKMKKLKEKYKDQDEEERQLRMDILASAGTKKEEKKKGKKDDKGSQGKKQQQQKKKPEPTDIILHDIQELNIEETAKEAPVKEAKDTEVEEEKQEEEEKPTIDDVQILNSLTGIPVTEDELLYAITVCAPYNALTNYKYKVKLLPGSTKRGKAAKTALNMFMFDKNVTSREKDLLKILKDADMSRNMPGKVKVTAPNLHKAKKR